MAGGLPKGGGRQGTPSWFLLSLCCLIFPAPIASSLGLSVWCGSLLLPSPTFFTFEKGEVGLPRGPRAGLTVSCSAALAALKLPGLSPTQVPTSQMAVSEASSRIVRPGKSGAPDPQESPALFCGDGVTTSLLFHCHSTNICWSSTLGQTLRTPGPRRQTRPLPFGRSS